MSIVQLWIEQDRARVAVDTIGYPGTGGPAREVCKLFPLPHAGVVVAYRGTDVGAFQVLAQVILGSAGGSYDQIAKAMPTHVRNAASQVPPRAPGAAFRSEIHLAGYSDAAERMAGHSWKVDLKERQCVPMPLSGPARIGPGFEDVPTLGSDQAMLETALRQMQWMRDNTPDKVTGGRLLVAEVTRGGVAVRDLGGL